MDFLTANPMLYEILSFLDYEAISECKRVNRRFYWIIRKYPSKFARMPVELSIGYKNGTILMDCDWSYIHKLYRTASINWSLGMALSQQRFQIFGFKANSFVESLEKLRGAQLNELDSPKEGDRMFEISDQLKEFSYIVRRILAKAELVRLYLEPDFNNTVISNECLTCIRDSIDLAKGRVRLASRGSKLRIESISPKYLDIMSVVEFDKVAIKLKNQELTDGAMTSMRTDLRVWLKIQIDKPIRCLKGILRVLQEWIDGKRLITRFIIEGHKDTTKVDLMEMFSKLEGFEKREETLPEDQKEPIPIASIQRKIDKKVMILSTREDNQYVTFQAQISDRKLFENVDSLLIFS